MKKAALLAFFHVSVASVFSSTIFSSRVALDSVKYDSIESIKPAKISPLKAPNGIVYGLMTLSDHRVSFDRGFIIPHHDDMYHLYQPVMSLQYQYLRSFEDSRKRLGLLAYATHKYLGTYKSPDGGQKKQLKEL